MDEIQKSKWYHNKALDVFLLLIFWPVGLPLMLTNKKFSTVSKAIITFVIVIITLSILSAKTQKGQTSSATQTSSSSNNSNSIPVPSRGIQVPSDQEAFVSAVSSFIDPYDSASNELKKSSLRTERKNRIKQVLKSNVINGWIGEINSLGTTSEGDAYVELQLFNSNVTVKTWNNTLSDSMDRTNTLIQHGSPLYTAIADLNKGDKVKIAGRFFSDSRDHIKETSATEGGSMLEPEFLIKFASIEKL